MTRIVFFDIDGTLLNTSKALPPETKDAIARLKADGVYVAIATGRAPFMFKELREELGIDTFVSYNGQYVMLEGELLEQHPLDRHFLDELKEAGAARNHPVVFMSADEMKATTPEHDHIASAFGSLHFDHPPSDPVYHHSTTILQALLFCEEKEQPDYEKAFPQFDFVRWHTYSMDVLPKGGSKANGIRSIVSKLGIPMDEVVAFGDGLNDREMLSQVGVGVAMGNAEEEVKKISKHITDHVDQNGIVNGLKKIGFLTE